MYVQQDDMVVLQAHDRSNILDKKIMEDMKDTFFELGVCRIWYKVKRNTIIQIMAIGTEGGQHPLFSFCQYKEG